MSENKLVVTMIADSVDGYMELTRTYDDVTTWPELIDQFNQFLAGLGYIATGNEFVEQKQKTL